MPRQNMCWNCYHCMGKSIQEWTKQNLWKAAFKKFEIYIHLIHLIKTKLKPNKNLSSVMLSHENGHAKIYFDEFQNSLSK